MTIRNGAIRGHLQGRAVAESMTARIDINQGAGRGSGHTVFFANFGEKPMTDGEVLYLAFVSGVALVFMIALAYGSNIASGGPDPDD